jgi:hypothetical protein
MEFEFSGQAKSGMQDVAMRVASLKWRGVVKKGRGCHENQSGDWFCRENGKFDIAAHFIEELKSSRNSTRSDIKREKGQEVQNSWP